MPGLTNLTPYPPNGGAYSNDEAFYRGGAGPVPPMPIGSAATGLGIPRPGATVTTNEFGLDVTELEWGCPTNRAAALRPEPRAKHPYLTGMYCVGSTSTDGEGLWSVVRATYKGLINDKARPAERMVTNETRSDSITLPDGALPLGGGGSGGTKLLAVQNIPVPQIVFTLRGATPTQPDDTQVGTFVKNPPRAPTPIALYEYPIVATQGDVVAVRGVLQYKPHPFGWLLEKQPWREAALHYEVTQQFRMDFRLYNIRAATAADNPTS